MKRDTFAAIDIGSNAFRLLVSYVEHSVVRAAVTSSSSPSLSNATVPELPAETSSPVEFRKAAFIRVPVRLGEDVFSGGRIGDEKRRKLVEAMQGFAHLMRVFDVRAYRACATSAMREAANGPEITEEILQKSGLRVEIISGHEEAETIFEAGDIAGLGTSDKRYLYVDVGGGSTEVTVYSNRERAFSESFRLGTVRMLSGADESAEMARFKERLHRIRKQYGPVAIIGSGGNINKAHKMLSKKERDKTDPLHFVELKLLSDQLKEMSYEERIEKFGLNEYRADVIIPALEIFITSARVCHIDEIIVPKIGLVDGIIHSLYPRSLQ